MSYNNEITDDSIKYIIASNDIILQVIENYYSTSCDNYLRLHNILFKNDNLKNMPINISAKLLEFYYRNEQQVKDNDAEYEKIKCFVEKSLFKLEKI